MFQNSNSLKHYRKALSLQYRQIIIGNAVYFVCKLKQTSDDFCECSSIELTGLDMIWKGGFLQPVHWLHQLRPLLKPFPSKSLKRVTHFNNFFKLYWHNKRQNPNPQVINLKTSQHIFLISILIIDGEEKQYNLSNVTYQFDGVM